MKEQLLWSIGAKDGRSTQLVDNYKQPTIFDGHVFNVDEEPETQDWPLFHPSEADPDAGYKLHPYLIKFSLNEIPSGSYLFNIHYLVIAPRLAHLEVKVNGVKGKAYLRPRPSVSGDITLHSGLHTTIYSEGIIEIIIPAALLIQGENVLELISCDGGDYIHVDNIEKIKRLDRMANGAGFIYQYLSFSKVEQEENDAFKLVEIQPSVLYKKIDGNLAELCQIYFELNKPIEETNVTLKLRTQVGEEVINLKVQQQAYGHMRHSFYVKDGEGKVQYELTGENGFYQTGTFSRRRKWKVYITPHSHTDIGYTHRQWEVAERLCRNIDTAIEVLEKEEKENVTIPAFAYHLDASWVLETFLETRSKERIEKLFKFVKMGKLGIPHSYLDLLTQYASLEELIRNGEYTESVLKPQSMRSTYNAIVDVPSMSGSLPAIYEGSGMKYLVHANNQDRGPFRLNGGLHKASPFYWEGVNGGRVLVWLSKMYCELRKVCGSPPVNSSAERGLEMWLDEYEMDHYKPDAVLLYGQEADNTDIDPQPIDFTKNWNQTYEYPKLIACDVNEFFEYVESNYGNSFQTVKGDGGAYWEDGVGSSIIPTIEVRKAQAMLPSAEKLESLAVIHNEGWEYPSKQFDQAWKSTLQYVEHTWGAFLSATDPDAILQQDQWAVKEHFAKEGYQWANRLLHTAAVRHSLNWNNYGREVVVYNPHSWTVSSEVIVEIAKNEQLIDPVTLEQIPTRIIRTTNSQAIVGVWVENVPGLSYRRIQLEEVNVTNDVIAEVASAVEDVLYENVVTLENEFYRVVISLEKGYITSLYDKELSKELVDSGDCFGFGQFVYASGGEGTRLVGNQKDLLDGYADILTEFTLKDYHIQSYSYGTNVTLHGVVPFGELHIEWKLLDHVKKVDVSYTYKKEERLEKEAVYVAFPLQLDQAIIQSDSQLGWVNWDQQMLPGGCKEWLPLQTGMLAQGNDADVMIASPDIPLFTIGNVVQGNWPKELDLSGSRIFSYVLNNYWNTNYKASQGGTISFNYSITSQDKLRKETAFRFGWESRLALYGHRISFQDFREVVPPYNQEVEGRLAMISNDKVALSTIKKSKWIEGWTIRLQEISGETQRTTIAIPGKTITRAWTTDLLEKELGSVPVDSNGSVMVDVPAWGLTTVRVELSANKEK